ncbi:LysR family transcriptional regulator [Rhodomicrobium sp. Az07]|uniref:LysR family transcriptional regulator n=1 Tax=Rhodomicrobium sp. Az07 TaxID=2839034 RepID=UPI001BE7B8C2|nr:LysR family transcriptional regulator [Rhodomicrobium sp. Az07]MBT3069659.1 LysR family transcriptional regulator [Rhodomicrobium sp. Az07]
MRDLNLDQVRTFLEVVKRGSFTAAARALNLTQPAVSQQIKELEARLGVQLVARLGKRAFATDAGKELVGRGGRLIADAGEAVLAVSRFRDGWMSPIRLGATITVCVYLLPRLLGELRLTHPELEVSIEIDLSHVIAEKVAANELDIGLVALPIDKAAPVSVTKVRDDPVMAVFPAHEDSALPAMVTADYLKKRALLLDLPTTQMHRLVVGWFEAQGFHPKPTLYLGNSEALKAMVAAGVGVAILAIEDREDLYLGRSIVARPLSPPLVRQLGLIVHKDKPPHPAIPEILDRLTNISA